MQDMMTWLKSNIENRAVPVSAIAIAFIGLALFLMFKGTGTDGVVITNSSGVNVKQISGTGNITEITLGDKTFEISEDKISLEAKKIHDLVLADSSTEISKAKVRELAKDLGLMSEIKINPHLRFIGGDISYWYEQNLGFNELALQFIARKVILDAADAQKIVIKDQGELSWLAQQIMGNILEKKALLISNSS